MATAYTAAVWKTTIRVLSLPCSCGQGPGRAIRSPRPSTTDCSSVSDEETGSGHGLDYVLGTTGRTSLTEEDIIVVPDFGSPDSSMLEVAEKSMLWLKISVFGKQCHASTPGSGVNTLRATAALILELDALYKRYDARDELVQPALFHFRSPRKRKPTSRTSTRFPDLTSFT